MYKRQTIESVIVLSQPLLVVTVKVIRYVISSELVLIGKSKVGDSAVGSLIVIVLGDTCHSQESANEELLIILIVVSPQDSSRISNKAIGLVNTEILSDVLF